MLPKFFAFLCWLNNGEIEEERVEVAAFVVSAEHCLLWLKFCRITEKTDDGGGGGGMVL